MSGLHIGPQSMDNLKAEGPPPKVKVKVRSKE